MDWNELTKFIKEKNIPEYAIDELISVYRRAFKNLIIQIHNNNELNIGKAKDLNDELNNRIKTLITRMVYDGYLTEDITFFLLNYRRFFIAYRAAEISNIIANILIINLEPMNELK